jgi:RhtB (resistance to homoserine/threonine) family protein
MSIGESIAGFALVAALLTILPGPDSALVLRSALVQGRRAAIATALGINSGSLVWGAAAGVGAAALIAASTVAFTVLKLAGAVYLAYLGIRMILASLKKDAGLESGPLALDAQPSWWAAYGRGALTNLLNPKVGAFYVALIPQFLPEGVNPLAMGLVLALVHVLESVIWFAILIVAAETARAWLSSARVVKWIDRVTGGVLLGFAGFLAIESQP